MRNPATATTTTDVRASVDPLTAFGEDREPVGLFTEPIDVSALAGLQLDECGRRSRWVPADCRL